MGYPMTFGRMIRRNNLDGDYDPSDTRGYIKGDLRRIENDTRDSTHLERYAKLADITVEQAKLIFDAFFHDYDTPWQLNHTCPVCNVWRDKRD